jgi:hypothetical protein
MQGASAWRGAGERARLKAGRFRFLEIEIRKVYRGSKAKGAGERQRRVLNAKEPAGCRRYKGRVKNAGRRPAVQKTKATSLEKTREKTKLEKTKEGRDADAEK